MHIRSTLFALPLLAASAVAQQNSTPPMDMKPGATMAEPTTLIDAELAHTSSGTSIEPASTPTPMWMFRPRAGWQLMLHGTASVADIQQHATDNPAPPPTSLCVELDAACVTPQRRGGDKLFSTNWIMPMAQHRLGAKGQLTVRAMFSLEPATIQSGEYPELFQQGETVNNRPIIDGQHPHDFFMEIAALYDLRLSARMLLSLYAAPVGDPAIGPTAYPHRQSASEDPIAALGHHQQDSTHIAFNVLTAGLTYRWARIEASGFHGAEPTTARWNPEPSPNGHALDSYSTRLTLSPTKDLTAQYSIAHLTAPEQLHPTEDQRRQTASIMYNRPIGAHHDTTSMPGMDMASPATGSWSTTLLWGQAHSLANHTNENSYLLESLVQFHTRNYLWTRIEAAGRSSELLEDNSAQFPPNADPDEVPIGHVQAYSLGYDRDYRLGPHLLAAPGAQFTLYRTPDSLVSTYGRTPFSGVVFVRFRIH